MGDPGPTNLLSQRPLYRSRIVKVRIKARNVETMVKKSMKVKVNLRKGHKQWEEDGND